MGSYVSPTAALLSSTGMSAPSFATLLSYLQGQWQSIYASDTVLTGATQDGQLLGVLTAAVNDANSALLNTYQSFSPASAQGAALSTNVQINGISRMVPTNSTVTLTVSGVVGTVIPAGVVADVNGYLWNLPANTTIGAGGTVSVTATCQTAGAINAAANSVTVISQGQVLGWQSVTNPAAASPGNPVEVDGALRQRQAVSTALPSLGVMDGVVGAVRAVPGVTSVLALVNESGSTTGYGQPTGTICLVVQGGTASAIAAAIATKKTPGIGTYGSTTVSVPVAWGPNVSINFVIPTQLTIKVSITLNPLTGYTSNVGTEIQNAVAAYINSLQPFQNVMIPRLYPPACLVGPFAAAAGPNGGPVGTNDPNTFELVSIELAVGSGSFAASDVTVAYNQVATCLASNVTITT